MFSKRFFFVVVLLSCIIIFAMTRNDLRKRVFEWCNRLSNSLNSSDSGVRESKNINLGNNPKLNEGFNFSNLKKADHFIQNPDYIFKLVFVSSTGCSVGKTNIINVARGYEFNSKYIPTEKAMFFGQLFKENTGNINAKTIRLDIWDTPSDEEYKLITEYVLLETNAFIFVYDITNVQSMNKLPEFIKSFRKDDGAVLFLLGNKLDLAEQKRQVSREYAEEFARTSGLIFLGECSAKDNTYIPFLDNSCFKEKDLVDGVRCKKGVEGVVNDILYNLHKVAKLLPTQ